MSMTTLEILEAARDLIRDKDKWFGGDSEYEDGRRCLLTSCSDVCGLYDFHHSHAADAWGVLGQTVRGLGFNGAITWFNDTHTHAEVLEIFNIAIANELSKETERSHYHSETERSQPKVRMATYNGHLEPAVA